MQCSKRTFNKVSKGEDNVIDPHREKVLILDFGSQYTQLIARRIRELHVYCEIHPYLMPLEQIRDFAPRGIVLSGGPRSVYEADAPLVGREVLELGVPVLGICYGLQLINHILGGKVSPAASREYGRKHFTITDHQDLFAGLAAEELVWMSHGDHVDELAPGLEVIGSSDTCAGRGGSEPEPGDLRGAVSSGSQAHPPRQQNFSQLSF